jgi:hypothetical protein
MQNKSKREYLLRGFIISTFVSLYLIVSVISTIHVIEFFLLSNPKWLAISLAIAFEVGAAASLASLIALEKMNKFLVWCLFITLTCMQAMGNTYYAYTNLHDFQSWVELFGLVEEDLIYQKRILSIVSGAILPLVALGFIKSLVDYIKPQEEKILESQSDTGEDAKKENIDASKISIVDAGDSNMATEQSGEVESSDALTVDSEFDYNEPEVTTPLTTSAVSEEQVVLAPRNRSIFMEQDPTKLS